MNILLVPLGSHGDVHPFVGIGLALKQRGHRVKVIVNPFFGSLVQGAGLEFVPVGTAEQYTTMAANPNMWRPIQGPKIAFAAIGDYIRPVYDAIVAHHVPGETVLVASTLAMGARVAEDRHGIPMASVHLQPSSFRSYIDPPKLPGMFSGPRVPRWLMAMQWKIADTVLDRLALPALNAFRKEVGLSPVRRQVLEYLHSPQRIIGMFPEWFAPIQADWPPQTRLTGFPLYDERGVTGLSAELQQFLREGAPPIAFTFGSAMWHAHELLVQSVQTCERLGRRGILLTRHREQVPAQLPPGVKHVDFVPFSELLPHCAALVHHGGIGTASQALATGVPQVIVPHSFDQFDNIARIERLGAGRMIPLKRYGTAGAIRDVGALLDDAKVVTACRAVAARFAGNDTMGKTCEWIEELSPKKL